MLSEWLDGLGLRRARVDWRVTDLEKRTVAVSMKALALEFGRLNLGRVHFEEWILNDNLDWTQYLEDYNHHMGTTRMADDPKKGVVNKDCRVHGIDNLYIAGSSVFPTSGHINPTLTLLALALKLADRLKMMVLR
jgi:choline dehydrogenase-like flavoprotein